MRPGQNKRMRGRPNNTGGGGNRKGPNPLTRSYESNGPDVKIRGNAHHVAEKYLQLARDAQSSGDPVAAESYLQHAEHYFRLIASAQAAQAGFTRQPDAVDTEGEDDEDSGIPDRFASPQPITPFVPQAPAQPYAAERQPYNGGERQSYADRPAGGSGDRQPYGDRSANGERPPYGDRNTYQQRQDRNGLNRRPYRDNVGGGDGRTDDRNGADRQDRPAQDRQVQERPSQDRQSQDRPSQDRPSQDRQSQDRQGQERTYQDRPAYQDRGDRQSRRERYGQDRQGQDRNGQDRNGQDRGFDRPDRQQGERYREPHSADQPRDPYLGEQPRIEAVADRQPDVMAPRPNERFAGAEPSPQPEAPPQAVARAEPAPRREPRQERAAVTAVDDAPGLPSFITTPTRVAPVDAVAAPEPSLTTTTAFPGDGGEEAPKFPRRRRRTTRATEGSEPAGEPSERSVTTGD